MEPDFAIALVKDDLDEDTEAYKEQKEISKTLDIEPALPFGTSVNENFDPSPQSGEIDGNCRLELRNKIHKNTLFLTCSVYNLKVQI